MQISAGYIQVFGNAYFDFSNQTIEFMMGQALPPNEVGDFLKLGPSLSQTYFQVGTDIPVASLTSVPNFLKLDNGAGVTATLSIETMTITANQPDLFYMVGHGSMAMTGFDTTPGFWGLAITPVVDPRAPTGWWEAVGFIPQPTTSVPGPIAGSGSVGLLALVLFALARLRIWAAKETNK